MSDSEFDPRIIERFAEQLLAKADSVRVGAAVGGGVLGVLFGAVPVTPLGNAWPIPATFGLATILIGGLVGVLAGYVIGEGRAFRYRVQAQMALFQVEIEKKIESVAYRPAAPAPAQGSAPAPAPAALSTPAAAPAPLRMPATTSAPAPAPAPPSAPAPAPVPARVAAQPMAEPPLSPAASR